ncbi:MAG: DUF2330 domain-containing protein [Myxococcales bacterium]|nr:DUF2330 domain-containing protein [Myxococcales bacterium]
MNLVLKFVLVTLPFVVAFQPSSASACGCFAQPSVTVSDAVVQAGERILFAVDNGTVTAHIQIQYSGNAQDFGWLLPLPSVPVVDVGTDELFAQLIGKTTPRYSVTGVSCQPPSLGCGPSAPIAGAATQNEQPPDGPLVIASSVGPYDYAVLKADDKTAMLAWLNTNRFFVPATSDEALAPYLRPGAYFLALKLRSGAWTGQIRPIVLKYASELPVIPITLTSIGAVPNMGIQVWVLGNARAIPRNFSHVELNDALLDWENRVKNYADVVTKAVAEAPGKHAFVTEYAGPSEVMREVLVSPDRFRLSEARLAALTKPEEFVLALFQQGFAAPFSERTAGAMPLPTLPTTVRGLVLTALPLPPGFPARGISEDAYLANITFYLGEHRRSFPEDFTGWQMAFDPPTLARAIYREHVTPLVEANVLFWKYSKLTRLFTTLSPGDMTKDPVFSFNASLPDVPLLRSASLQANCSAPSRPTLVTAQGWRRTATGSAPTFTTVPAARRIEVLSEEGPPTLTTDNEYEIDRQFDNVTPPVGGCSTVDVSSVSLLWPLLVLRLRRTRSRR